MKSDVEGFNGIEAGDGPGMSDVWDFQDTHKDKGQKK